MWALLLLLVRGLSGIINQFHSLLGLTFLIHLISIGHKHLLNCMIKLTLSPTLVQPRYVVSGIERPPISYPALIQPCYVAQITKRPPALYPRPKALQASSLFALRTPKQFSQLGMSLRQALRKLNDIGLLTLLALKSLSQPILPQFRMDLHYAYHQRLGHTIDHYTALRHAI